MASRLRPYACSRPPSVAGIDRLLFYKHVFKASTYLREDNTAWLIDRVRRRGPPRSLRHNSCRCRRGDAWSKAATSFWKVGRPTITNTAFRRQTDRARRPVQRSKSWSRKRRRRTTSLAMAPLPPPFWPALVREGETRRWRQPDVLKCIEGRRAVSKHWATRPRTSRPRNRSLLPPDLGRRT